MSEYLSEFNRLQREAADRRDRLEAERKRADALSKIKNRLEHRIVSLQQTAGAIRSLVEQGCAVADLEPAEMLRAYEVDLEAVCWPLGDLVDWGDVFGGYDDDVQDDSAPSEDELEAFRRRVAAG